MPGFVSIDVAPELLPPDAEGRRSRGVLGGWARAAPASEKPC